METVTLAATIREVGKKATKAVRKKGCIPANLYGHGMKPLSIEVPVREFLGALHTKAGENVLISLNVTGIKLEESTCVIKEIQHHPVTEEIAHVDLTVISLTEKISVRVPVVVKNAEEALGVKEGGVLDVIHHEIEVECLPTQIPENITVDVKGLKIGDAIYVKDLALPADLNVRLGAEDPIVVVHVPREEEKPAEEEVAAQPEVIEKGKKPEEGAAEAEGAAEKAPAKPEKGAPPGKKE